MRLHIIPGIGKRKLKSLQAAHIREWLTNLRTTCQCCSQGRDAARCAPRCCAKPLPECCGSVLSASSIRHILRVLRAALQDAVDEEMLSRNVARLVQLRVTDERRVRSFTREEALRFLQTAETHRLYALWAVALSMGLRRGEALGLAWSDVDLDKGRLTVRQALHRVDGQLRLDPVKTDASVAVLPIPTPLVAILRAHRQASAERARRRRLTLARHRPGVHDSPRWLHRTAQREPNVPRRLHEGRSTAAACPRPSALLRHPAFHDGCSARDCAADSATQLDHRDHWDLRGGDRGCAARRAGFDGQPFRVRCRFRLNLVAAFNHTFGAQGATSADLSLPHQTAAPGCLQRKETTLRMRQFGMCRHPPRVRVW